MPNVLMGLTSTVTFSYGYTTPLMCRDNYKMIGLISATCQPFDSFYYHMAWKRMIKNKYQMPFCLCNSKTTSLGTVWIVPSHSASSCNAMESPHLTSWYSLYHFLRHPIFVKWSKKGTWYDFMVNLVLFGVKLSATCWEIF